MGSQGFRSVANIFEREREGGLSLGQVKIRIGHLTALMTSLLVGACSCSQPAKSGDVEVEVAVREVLAAQVEAWNQGDLERFMQGYWNSPELTFFSGGRRISGWEETLQRYRTRYQTEGQEMRHLEFPEIRVDVLSTDSAVVRGRFHLQQSAGNAEGRFTLLFRKFPQGWKIIHDHTS